MNKKSKDSGYQGLCLGKLSSRGSLTVPWFFLRLGFPGTLSLVKAGALTLLQAQGLAQAPVHNRAEITVGWKHSYYFKLTHGLRTVMNFVDYLKI